MSLFDSNLIEVSPLVSNWQCGNIVSGNGLASSRRRYVDIYRYIYVGIENKLVPEMSHTYLTEISNFEYHFY